MTIRGKDEIEALKANWKKDPIWDLEDSEGFEEHREELLRFSQECEAQWAERAKKEHDRLASKVCPLSTFSKHNILQAFLRAFLRWKRTGNHSHCLVEKCAFWNDNLGVCGAIATGYLAGIKAAKEEL